MEIEGLYDVEYIVENKKPIIYLFYRENKEKKIKKIENFYPYLYVKKEDFERKKIWIKRFIKNIEEINEYIKITTNEPRNIYYIKKYFEETFEADILFTNRYIIDNINKLNKGNYRIHYFDIETTSFQGFPKWYNPIENIISIAAYDTYNKKTYLWIYHKKYKKETIIKDTKHGQLEIKRFNTEKDMLNNYLDFYIETKPDYVTAWNVFFDINYLISRCEYLGLEVGKLSPLYNTEDGKKFNKLIQWRKGSGVSGKIVRNTNIEEKHPHIIGLQYFDLLLSYKRIIAKERESWSLDYISKVELNMEKLRTHFDIGKKWLEEPEYIEKYNYIDALLIRLLDEKIKITEYYNNIKDTAFLYNINDVLSSGKVLDNYLLKKYKNKFIFPSKKFRKGKENIHVAGGFVKQPSPGIYENIAVFDFSGFYPNLMKTFNLSPDVVENEKVYLQDISIEEQDNLDSELLEDWKNKDYYKIRTDKFKADIKINRKKKGIITQIVSELVKLRTNAKKEMRKFEYGSMDYKIWYNKQFSYKFLINAVYGVNAYPGFRLFNPILANTITGFARMFAKWIGYNFRKNNYNWIYSDTDSCFIQLKTNNLKDNLKEIAKIEQEIINPSINSFIKKFLYEEEISEHTIKMDCEKIYSKLLLLSKKKKYIGYLKWYDNEETHKLHFMGIDFKKSNLSHLEKWAQRKITEDLLQNKNIEKSINEIFQKLKKEEDINFFKTPGKLEKKIKEYKVNSPTIRAVKWSNDNLNTQFKSGNKFYNIYVNHPKTDIIAFQDEKQLKKMKINLEIDKKKYIEKVYKKLSIILEGTKYEKILNNIYNEKILNNTTLRRWF